MIVKFRMPAAEGEAYAPGCLDESIGQEVMVKGVAGRMRGVLRSADVAEDGQSVEVGLEIPDDAESMFVRNEPVAGYSIGFDA